MLKVTGQVNVRGAPEQAAEEGEGALKEMERNETF